MKKDLLCHGQRCHLMILVSGSIRFMQIFVGVLWRGDVKQQCDCRKWQFSVLSLTISSEALQVRPTLLYSTSSNHPSSGRSTTRGCTVRCSTPKRLVSGVVIPFARWRRCRSPDPAGASFARWRLRAEFRVFSIAVSLAGIRE